MADDGLLLLCVITPSEPRLLIVSSGEFSDILARLKDQGTSKTFSHERSNVTISVTNPPPDSATDKHR